MTHVGGYHEYRGGVQCRGGTQITKDDIIHGTEDILSPTVLNTPHDTEHTLYRVSLNGVYRRIFYDVILPRQRKNGVSW